MIIISGSARASGRRRRRTTAVAVGSLVAAALAVVAGPGTPAGAAGTSCSLDSRFGRMFPSLPSASWTQEDLTKLAEKSTETAHFEPSGTPRDEMPDFPVGYNYVGQFIDHDIVLDDRPSDLTTPVDTTTLTNRRTPSLDLDSLYVNDPAAYRADGTFVLGAALTGAESDPGARDLLRSADGQAIIGDRRNDENKIVASFHSLMMRFHNRMVGLVRLDHPTWTDAQVFAEARKQVTWYYQFALLTDFLPKMVGTSELAQVVTRQAGTGWTTNLRFYDSCRGAMPLEFSGAAYRFGHSLVRNDYQINERLVDLEVFTADSFSRQDTSLVGFGPTPSNFGIDWKYFLDLDGRPATTPQDAYQFDNSLVPALRLIPGRAAGGQSTILTTRNLLRGQQLGLPSGQDVARAMGVTPLPDSKIWAGPAVYGTPSGMTVPITSVSPAFAGKAPLWTYILAEAAEANTVQSSFIPGRTIGLKRQPERLGPVGGRIVAETLVGLLKADPTSVINNPTWTPDRRLTSVADRFRLSDIVSVATDLNPVAVDESDLEEDGSVYVGRTFVGTSDLELFRVRNHGGSRVGIGRPTVSGPGFSLYSGSCGTSTTTLAPGDSCSVTVRFRPSVRGAATGAMSMPTSGSVYGPVRVVLKGDTY